MEYKLFRAIEYARYGGIISNGFPSVEEFINTANAVLNRRKSRAGKSLEHHLSAIFTKNKLQYKAQAVTEGNKKPDFIFPSQEAYHDLSFSTDKLISLAAKQPVKIDGVKLSMRPIVCGINQNISAPFSREYLLHRWMKCRKKMLYWSFPSRISLLIREIDRTESGLLPNLLTMFVTLRDSDGRYSFP